MRWCGWGFAALLIYALLATPLKAEVLPIVVDVKPIGSFDLDNKTKTRFGALEFVGGLVMRSSSRHFGALSGLRVGRGRKLFAVTDTGFWITGDIQRSPKGEPIGLDAVEMAPLLDGEGKPFGHKWQADAESLTFAGQTVYVGLEQDSRIIRYKAEGGFQTSPSKRVTEYFREGVFGYNNGFEAIATFPPTHPLAGNLITFRETTQKNAEKNSPIPGFILKGKALRPISLVGRGGFNITDADFLPSGDLLILERLFSMSRGVKIRIRRIKGASIKVGASLDGDVIFEAGRGQQVDNMEGLSVFTASDGSTRVGLVSDNNHWLLQRNLYLEFKLVDQNR